MSMNTAELLRFQMSDKPKMLIDTYIGDGTAAAFQLSGNPLVSGCTSLGGFAPSAFVMNANGDAWTATAMSSVNYALGLVTFSNPIPKGAPVQFRYTYGIMSDEEIDWITAQTSDLNRMKLYYIDAVAFDYSKRVRWGAGGTYYDDATTLANILRVRETIWKQLTLELGPEGGVESWAEQQENHS